MSRKGFVLGLREHNMLSFHVELFTMLNLSIKVVIEQRIFLKNDVHAVDMLFRSVLATTFSLSIFTNMPLTLFLKTIGEFKSALKESCG